MAGDLRTLGDRQLDDRQLAELLLPRLDVDEETVDFGPLFFRLILSTNDFRQVAGPSL